MEGIGKLLLAVFAVIALIAVIGILWFLGTYNSLIATEQNVNEKWSQVENQYQRRADLIPNLVTVVQKYAEHEKTVFEEVTKARSQWASAKTVDDKVTAAEQMDSTIARLLVVAENYPTLKASDNFIALQADISGTENRVAVARMDYNSAVKEYNTKIKTVPTSFVASIYGYQLKRFFEAKQGSEIAPDIAEIMKNSNSS